MVFHEITASAIDHAVIGGLGPLVVLDSLVAPVGEPAVLVAIA